MKFFFPVVLLSAICFLSPLTAGAQVIDASVSVNSERLAPDVREDLAGLDQEIERYVEETRWIGDEWSGAPIKMNISIGISEGSADGSMRASLMIISQRQIKGSSSFTPLMRIVDDEWNFRYTRGAPLQQDAVGYDPLTGLIDFYVYVALGLDLDTYGYLGGKYFYEEARNVARRAELVTTALGWSRDVSSGAFTRQGFISELTNIRFYPLRKFLLDYHYNGIDNLAEYPEVALDSINKYVTDLMIIKNRLVESSTIIRVINDTKYREWAELFEGYADPKIWDKLLLIDPTHQTFYQEARG